MSLLRYKFILLTKNHYISVGVHCLFQEMIKESTLDKFFPEVAPLYQIEKYSDLLPFLLRFDSVSVDSEVDPLVSHDITLLAKGEEFKMIKFESVLFFVDTFNLGRTSFISIAGKVSLDALRLRLKIFFIHCHSVIVGAKMYSCNPMILTLREQKILLYLLKGMPVKRIASKLGVKDKRIYRARSDLTNKIINQQGSCLIRRVMKLWAGTIFFKMIAENSTKNKTSKYL